MHVITSTYVSLGGLFYEQTDGVALSSPLSPVSSNFFMDDFEERACVFSLALQGRMVYFLINPRFTVVVWSGKL
jgi:hypothetical protein